MDDLNTILGIVVVIPLLTLFTVYWLDGRSASTQAVPYLRAGRDRHDHLKAEHTTCGSHCSMHS
jgi:hypothetical protein